MDNNQRGNSEPKYEYHDTIKTVKNLFTDIDKIRHKINYYSAVDLLQRKILWMIQNGQTETYIQAHVEGIPCGDAEYSPEQYVAIVKTYLDDSKKYRGIELNENITRNRVDIEFKVLKETEF